MWGRSRSAVLITLLVVSLAKAVAFSGLVAARLTGPFVGDNARDHFVPIAERLVHEHRFNGPDSRPDSKVPPGYPVLLATAIASHVPQPLAAVVIVQMLFDLLSALCLYWCGVMMRRPLVGAIGGLAWLLYPPAVIISTWVAQETVFTGFFMLAIALVLRGFLADRRRLAWTLAAGVAMGVSAMFRATPQIIAVFLLLLWLGQRRWKEPLAFVAGMALVIAPWAVRNHLVLGDNIVIATGSGSPFLLGSSDEEVQHPDVKSVFLEEVIQEGARNGVVKPTSDKESQIDGWEIQLALHRYRRRLTERPLSFVSLTARKFLRLWYATDVSAGRTPLILGVLSLLIVPFACWRIWTWRRTDRPLFILFGCVLAYFVVLHVIMLPMNRYMVPIFPLLLYAVADGIVRGLKLDDGERLSDSGESPVLRDAKPA